MSVLHVPLPKLETAIQEVCRVLEQRDHLIPPWDKLHEDDLWRELVACILGSRVRFHIAHAAVERMDRANLFAEERRSSDYNEYEHDVMKALTGRAKLRGNFRSQCCYPFPQLKAQQIRAAAETLYAQRRTIRELLKDARDRRAARRRLATEVSGMGPKQASLFLRNIGYTAHVAVLDIHILTYMNWVGLTPTPMKSVRTVQQYETIEDKFIEHACSAGYSPHYFDVAVWIVVRVAKREYRTWR